MVSNGKYNYGLLIFLEYNNSTVNQLVGTTLTPPRSAKLCLSPLVFQSIASALGIPSEHVRAP